MKTLLSLTMFLLSAYSFATLQLNDLTYEERAVMEAEVHIAKDQKHGQFGAYIAVENYFTNTISCSGKFWVIIEKDGSVKSHLLTFNNLEVFPSKAFSYRVVYLLGKEGELSDGYMFAAEKYTKISVNCRGWDFTDALHPKICAQNKGTHDEICATGTTLYPFMIADFWLGSCRCDN